MSATWDTSHWVPDEAVSDCAAPDCARSFGRLVRKHHCRRCGRVFCAQCTPRRLKLTPSLQLDSERGVAVRVCASCAAEVAELSEGHAAGIAPEQAVGDDAAPPARDWTAALVRARAKHAARARLDISDVLHHWARASAPGMLAPLPGAMATRAARATAEGGGLRWEEDNSRVDCPLCSVHFSTLTRRHHCRLCGTLCCARCSFKMQLRLSQTAAASVAGGSAAERSRARVAGALVAAASAGLPPTFIRTCSRCAELLERQRLGVAYADALAAAGESALVRTYAKLAAARAAISEQMALYAKAVSRLDLALEPQALANELVQRERTLGALLPQAMAALKALAASPATPAEARVAVQAKAMAVTFLQATAPRFHALKRASELKLAQAREEAALPPRRQLAAAEGGSQDVQTLVASGVGESNQSNQGSTRFLSRIVARTAAATATAAAAAATAATLGGAAAATLGGALPARGGAALSRLYMSSPAASQGGSATAAHLEALRPPT
ncbi:hypothetical protein T492DRAFT_915697 [Pavlovales sp. CCMP2436]|nr:hypothetical protein T492DRAFT_915697 [Pavlovales sp. CCMP2436]